MQLKQYDPFMIDFRSKSVRSCCAAMGLSLFLRFFCYFGFWDLTNVGAGEIVFRMILPAILVCGFLVLFGVIRWNVPGIYAIAGAAMCLLLMVECFFSGDVLRIVLGVLGYLIGGALLVITVAGYLPGRLPATVVFAALFLGRVLLSVADFHGIRGLICDLSGAFTALSLLAFTRCLKPIEKNTEE